LLAARAVTDAETMRKEREKPGKPLEANGEAQSRRENRRCKGAANFPAPAQAGLHRDQAFRGARAPAVTYFFAAGAAAGLPAGAAMGPGDPAATLAFLSPE